MLQHHDRRAGCSGLFGGQRWHRGPTDAAGGYVDGSTAAALAQNQLNVYDVLQNNDAYHALKAVDGLIITGATGTNVNDVAVVLIGNQG